MGVIDDVDGVGSPKADPTSDGTGLFGFFLDRGRGRRFFCLLPTTGLWSGRSWVAVTGPVVFWVLRTLVLRTTACHVVARRQSAYGDGWLMASRRRERSIADEELVLLPSPEYEGQPELRTGLIELDPVFGSGRDSPPAEVPSWGKLTFLNELICV